MVHILQHKSIKKYLSFLPFFCEEDDGGYKIKKERIDNKDIYSCQNDSFVVVKDGSDYYAYIKKTYEIGNNEEYDSYILKTHTNSGTATRYSVGMLKRSYYGNSASKEDNVQSSENYEVDNPILSTADVWYYSQADNGDLQTYLKSKSNGDVVIISDETDSGKITICIPFKVVHKVGSTTYYVVDVDYSLSLSVLVQETTNSSYEGDFVLSSNELQQQGVKYVDSTTSITNAISISRGTASSLFTVNSSSNVASDLTITIKTSGFFTSLWYGKNTQYYTATISSGSSASASLECAPFDDIEIIDVLPYSDNQYVYFAPNKQIQQFVADKIVENYSDGKATCVLDCSIDDYYNYGGDTMVISKYGESGLPMTFKNNDIVYPRRVAMVETITSGSKKMEQQETDLVNGKIFRIVGVKVKYDGCVMQELTLQEEKTQ